MKTGSCTFLYTELHPCHVYFFFQDNILLTDTVVDIEDDDDFERSLVFVHVLKRECFLSKISTNAAAILV